jgi:hypothetical protein
MNFLDSYGYDQISVDPVRCVDYEDSEFTLARNNMRDPITKKLHEQARMKRDYYEYKNNTPFYTNDNMKKRYERRQIKENIEDILRPYSRSTTGNDYVQEQRSNENNNAHRLEEAFGSRSACKNCRIKKKCGKCSENKSSWVEANADTNLYLIILVVILSVFCVTQYVNTQAINATLMGMINKQQNSEPQLSNKPNKNNKQDNISKLTGDSESSPFVTNTATNE